MSEPERVAIVGSRDYPNLDAVRRYVRTLPHGTTVVSGGARGVDQAAAAEARRCGLAVEEILPDYARYGRTAPLERNTLIAERCTRLVAFWHHKSRGTEHVLNCAYALQRPVEINI